MESNLIAQLQETRANLREALAQLSHLENKFLGPRPKDGQTGNPPQSDSVGVLLSDIRILSGSVLKGLCAHHDVVGSFNQEQACNPVASTAGQMATRYA